MKKILVLIATGLLLTGCATISEQYNQMEQMRTYTFDKSPEALYASAEKSFENDKLPLTSTGVNTGVSTWRTAYISQGSLTHTAKVRYSVSTSSAGGGKSIVRVQKETVPVKLANGHIGGTLGTEMLTPTTIRHIPSEYRILEFIDPAAAASLGTSVAKK
ncbi:MAG TPA: hypothetical protein ENI64_08655 [Gammaproteobacteria bacterium]|nr:hypothetical protein [Gammaproteobacteria bacterium]